jgi:hypothetical protein
MVLCILIYAFLGSRWENKGWSTEWQEALPKFNLAFIH